MVTQARVSLADPGVNAVLITGRPHYLFHARTLRQLASKGLAFPDVRLAPNLDTTAFKAQEMSKLVRQRRPSFVVVWDDKDSNLVAFAAVLEAASVPYRLNKVVA
jgi:hypothetical protein